MIAVARPGAVSAVCENAMCPQAGRSKDVSYPHLGQDVYLAGPLVCGVCGQTMSVEPADG